MAVVAPHQADGARESGRTQVRVAVEIEPHDKAAALGRGVGWRAGGWRAGGGPNGGGLAGSGRAGRVCPGLVCSQRLRQEHVAAKGNPRNPAERRTRPHAGRTEDAHTLVGGGPAAQRGARVVVRAVLPQQHPVRRQRRAERLNVHAVVSQEGRHIARAAEEADPRAAAAAAAAAAGVSLLPPLGRRRRWLLDRLASDAAARARQSTRVEPAGRTLEPAGSAGREASVRAARARDDAHDLAPRFCAALRRRDRVLQAVVERMRAGGVRVRIPVGGRVPG
eukprot:5072711-Prymnesium_polylepis.1